MPHSHTPPIPHPQPNSMPMDHIDQFLPQLNSMSTYLYQQPSPQLLLNPTPLPLLQTFPTITSYMHDQAISPDVTSTLPASIPGWRYYNPYSSIYHSKHMREDLMTPVEPVLVEPVPVPVEPIPVPVEPIPPVEQTSDSWNADGTWNY
jgi:hypothetical protein